MMFDDNIKKLKKRLLNAHILLFIMLYVNSCFVDLFWKIPSVVNKQVKYWNDYENGKENLSFMKQLHHVSFVRLSEAGFFLLCGMFFDSATQRNQRIKMVFLSSSLTLLKFIDYTIFGMNNHIARHYYQKLVTIQIISLCFHKAIKFLSIVTLVKWFNKNQVSLVIPVFLTNDIVIKLF